MSKSFLVNPKLKLSHDFKNAFVWHKLPEILPDERNLNIFQANWKSKALISSYFLERVTESTFIKRFKANRDIKFALCMLETCLDRMLFRSLFCSNILSARKMITNGLVFVDEKRVRQPSYNVKIGERIHIVDSAIPQVKNVINNPSIKIWAFIPAYIMVDHVEFSMTLINFPRFNQIPCPFDENIIRRAAAFYNQR